MTGVVNQPLWLVLVVGGLDGGVTRGDMGLEKLIEALWLNSFPWSEAVDMRSPCLAAPPVLRSPSLLAPVTASLAARRCWGAGESSFGIAGTGGALASAGGDTLALPDGDGERKVLSLIEPALGCRRTAGALAALAPDPLLCMRLVWMLPTGTGEVLWVRRAAAAAAEERDALEFTFLRNA